VKQELERKKEDDMKTIATLTLVTFAVAMAMLAAPTVYAQEESFNAEIGNGRWSAVEPPVSLADTQPAEFNAEIGNLPASGERNELAASAPEQTVKIGNLKLAAATLTGGVILQPGEYEVWKVNAGEQQFVEFSQILEDDYAPEGQSVYVRQAIARVSSTREAPDTTVAQNRLRARSR
jgi:hypothetical protein